MRPSQGAVTLPSPTATGSTTCAASVPDPHTRIPEVIRTFTAARLAGDADASAACCTEDVVLESPYKTIAGLDALRAQIFAGAAPEPVATVATMHLAAPDKFCAAEVSPMGKPVQIRRYRREFEVMAGAGQCLTISQDLYVQQPLRPESGQRELGSGAKICKIRMQVLA